MRAYNDGGTAEERDGGDAPDRSRVRLLSPASQEQPRVLLDTALALHQLGEHAHALELLDPLTLRPDAIGSEALWLAALCHVGRGAHREAATCLELALLETPVTELGRVALLYELGAVHDASGDRERALECFLAVRRRAPWFRDAASRAHSLRE